MSNGLGAWTRLARAPWRLRVKLTLSFMLVTVAAVLVFDMLDVGMQAASMQAPLPPLAIARALAQIAVPNERLNPSLARSRIPGVWHALAQVALAEAMQDNADTSGGIGTPGSALAIVDTRRRVLALLPPEADLPVGSRIDRGRLAALAPILAAALAGEREPARLAVRTAGGLVLAVAPVIDDDGRVEGAVIRIARFSSWLQIVAGEIVESALVLTLGAGAMGTLFGFLTARGLTRRFERLSRAARSWSRGDFGARAIDTSPDELGHLAQDLNRMAVEVRLLIQERQAMAELEARGRLARDLHDAVKQQVFAAAMQVGAARKLLGRDQPAAQAHLAQAEALVRGTQQELTTLIGALRPPVQDGQELATALRAHAEAWTQQTAIPLAVDIQGERATSGDVAQAVFRAAQEALANVARHSAASAAGVSLSWDEANVTLNVFDNGRGFTPTATTAGFGLESIRTRVAQVGGHASIRSAPGRGTTVICVCPRDGARRTQEDGRWPSR